MPQRTASTTLRNSTRTPSPVRFTTRPLWTAIVGSTRSLRRARSLANVRSSSAPASRLNPTTSAARIAASFRDSVMSVPQVSRREVLNLTSSGPSFLERERQLLLARVDDEHRQQLGRLGLAGIGADGVAAAGQLGEALSGLVGRHRSVMTSLRNAPSSTVA